MRFNSCERQRSLLCANTELAFRCDAPLERHEQYACTFKFLMRRFNRYENSSRPTIQVKLRLFEHEYITKTKRSRKWENGICALRFALPRHRCRREHLIWIYQWPNARPMPNGDLIDYVTCKQQTHARLTLHSRRADLSCRWLTNQA